MRLQKSAKSHTPGPVQAISANAPFAAELRQLIPTTSFGAGTMAASEADRTKGTTANARSKNRAIDFFMQRKSLSTLFFIGYHNQTSFVKSAKIRLLAKCIRVLFRMPKSPFSAISARRQALFLSGRKTPQVLQQNGTDALC